MATNSGDRREIQAWRKSLGDLFIAAGVLVLVVGALFWTRTALAASQINTYRYLPSSVRPALPLPSLMDAGGQLRLASSPSPESPQAGLFPVPNGKQPGPETVLEAGSSELLESLPSTPRVTEAIAEPTPTAGQDPVETSAPDVTEAIVPTATLPSVEVLPASESPTALEPLPASTEGPTPTATETPLPPTETLAPPTETPVLPTETPIPPTAKPTIPATLPPYSPVVRLVIPALEVDRAAVPVGIRPTSGGSMEWDTDVLFATKNRPDLVGQLVGSYSPGQGGNIVLIGHNYNQVDYGWTGVFVNIKTLSPGDLIGVFTEDGRQTNYKVVLVKQVPWRSKNENELEKHLKYMGSTPNEQLTLVTCGGANIWPFPARVYVVAEPVR